MKQLCKKSSGRMHETKAKGVEYVKGILRQPHLLKGSRKWEQYFGDGLKWKNRQYFEGLREFCKKKSKPPLD